jgi:hypothetical protein
MPKRSRTTFWDEYVRTVEKTAERRTGVPTKKKKAKKTATAHAIPAPRARKSKKKAAPIPEPTPKRKRKKASTKAAKPKRQAKATPKTSRSTAHAAHHPPCVDCGHPQKAHAHDAPHLCSVCPCFGFKTRRRKS